MSLITRQMSLWCTGKHHLNSSGVWFPRLKALLALGSAGSSISVTMDWLDQLEPPESPLCNDCFQSLSGCDGSLRVLLAETLELHQRFDDAIRYAVGEIQDPYCFNGCSQVGRSFLRGPSALHC